MVWERARVWLSEVLHVCLLFTIRIHTNDVGLDTLSCTREDTKRGIAEALNV